jgi:hypothetical protein
MLIDNFYDPLRAFGVFAFANALFNGHLRAGPELTRRLTGARLYGG